MSSASGTTSANELNEKAPEPSWENDAASIQNKQTITAALESYYKSDVSKPYEESRQELRKAELSIVRPRQTKGTVDSACVPNTIRQELRVSARTQLVVLLRMRCINRLTTRIRKLSDSNENKTESVGAYAGISR